MKKIISLTSIAVLLLAGCTKLASVSNYAGIEYRLYYDFNAPNAYDIRFLNRDMTSYKNYIGLKKALKVNLKIAAVETKKKGFNYFVLTNDGVNNLNGFPINTYSELLRYVTLKQRKSSFATNGTNQSRGKWPLLTLSTVNIGFKPVEDKYKNSYISVWSVEQTLRDTK